MKLYRMAYSSGVGHISSAEAARRLGISPRRVLALISAGHLAAERIGGVWIIDETALAAVSDRRPGRPKWPSDRKDATA